jgi:hypothetical protein
MSYGPLSPLLSNGIQDLYLNPQLILYDFALTPLNYQPSGYLNYSRISLNFPNSQPSIEIDYEHIQSLKLRINQNDVKAMRILAEYYLTLNNCIKMLKYYILYINNVEINKLHKIIKVCRETKNIKQFGELGDLCLDRIDIENNTDECPICYDGCGKYKTICCKQFVHYNCVHSCKTCPFCRAKIF